MRMPMRVIARVLQVVIPIAIPASGRAAALPDTYDSTRHFFGYVCGILPGCSLPVLQYGGTPADGSANAAAVPIAGYQLLAALAANPNRASVECQNQDTSLVQLVLDDGAGTAATISSYMLAAAGVTGGQGASWSDPNFKGRLRAYGPTPGQRVMCRQE